MVERYECTTGGHNKFWEVWVENSTLYCHWGRIGTDGQIKEEELSSPDLAEKKRENLVKEKLRRGYKKVNPRNAASPDKELLARYEPTDTGESPSGFIKDVTKLLNYGLSKQMPPKNMQQLFDIMISDDRNEQDDVIKTLAPDIVPLMKKMANGYDCDISAAYLLLMTMQEMYEFAIKSRATKFMTHVTDYMDALYLVRGSDSSQIFSKKWLVKQINAGKGRLFYS